MPNKTLYPKVYATLIEYVIQGQRAGKCNGIGQPIKTFTPAEWEEKLVIFGKRRYYHKGSIMKVKLTVANILC